MLKEKKRKREQKSIILKEKASGLFEEKKTDILQESVQKIQPIEKKEQEKFSMEIISDGSSNRLQSKRKWKQHDKHAVKRKKINEDQRFLTTMKTTRLDSLARLFEGSSICTAVCFDGKRLLIAANQDSKNKELIPKVMSYLSDVANGEDSKKKTIEIIKLIATDYVPAQHSLGSYLGYFDNHTNNFLENLENYMSEPDYEEPLSKYLLKQKHEDINALAKVEKGDFKATGHIHLATAAISRLIRDLEKLKANIRPGIKRSEQDEKIIQAFKNSHSYLKINKEHGSNQDKTSYQGEDEGEQYGYELLHIKGVGEKSSKDGERTSLKPLHAEMQIVQRLIDKGLHTNPTYIGISKLCCLDCHAAIKAVNKVNKEILTEVMPSQDSEKTEVINSAHLSFRGHHNINFGGTHHGDARKKKKDNWAKPYFITNSNSKDTYRKHYTEIRKKLINKLKEIQKSNMLSAYSDSEAEIDAATSKILNNNLQKHKENACNQYSNQKYWYQSNDILYVEESIKHRMMNQEIEVNKLVFQKALSSRDKEMAKQVIRQYITEHMTINKEENNYKPSVGVYNVHGNHWISYAIEKQESGEIRVSYKDSLGEKQRDFEETIVTAVREIIPNTQITTNQLDVIKFNDLDTGTEEQRGRKNQLDGSACGIFALKNMEIIANTILRGKDLSLLSTDKNDFYNTSHQGKVEEHNSLIKAAREEYGILYAEALKDEIEDKFKDYVKEDRAKWTYEALNLGNHLSDEFKDNMKKIKVGIIREIAIDHDIVEGLYLLSYNNKELQQYIRDLMNDINDKDIPEDKKKEEIKAFFEYIKDIDSVDSDIALKLNNFLNIEEKNDFIKRTQALLAALKEKDKLEKTQRVVDKKLFATLSSHSGSEGDISDDEGSLTASKGIEDSKNITYADKYQKEELSLLQILYSNNDREKIDQLKLFASIELKAKVAPIENNKIGEVNIVIKRSHGQEHISNIDNIVKAIENKKIDSNITICLERKEMGENFGMQDVILLSNILQHNEHNNEKIQISDEIKSQHIYADALLYKEARKHGIRVVGIESKDILSVEEREKHIAKRVAKEAKNGKDVVVFIEDSHTGNIQNILKEKNIASTVKNVSEINKKGKQKTATIDRSKEGLSFR